MNEFQYKTIREIVTSSRYPFTIGQLRHFLIHRHKNGLEMAVRKIGRRIYLRVDLFDRWIESSLNENGGLSWAPFSIVS